MHTNSVRVDTMENKWSTYKGSRNCFKASVGNEYLLYGEITVELSSLRIRNSFFLGTEEEGYSDLVSFIDGKMSYSDNAIIQMRFLLDSLDIHLEYLSEIGTLMQPLMDLVRCFPKNTDMHKKVLEVLECICTNRDAIRAGEIPKEDIVNLFWDPV